MNKSEGLECWEKAVLITRVGSGAREEATPLPFAPHSAFSQAPQLGREPRSQGKRPLTLVITFNPSWPGPWYSISIAEQLPGSTAGPENLNSFQHLVNTYSVPALCQASLLHT